MFLHVVLYRLRAELGDAARRRVDELIRSLAATVPGVLELRAGPNLGPAPFTKGYDWGFCMRFADRAARDAYLDHPVHRSTAEDIEKLIDDLVVLGIEAPG